MSSYILLGGGDSISYFPKKIKNINVLITSILPKDKSFKYNYYNYNGSYTNIDVTVNQKLRVGFGFGINNYWRFKKRLVSGLYFSISNILNVYYQVFTKNGFEYINSNQYYSSNIKDCSTNIVYEPSLGLSYRTILKRDFTFNFESGIGLNYNIFYFLKKSSIDLFNSNNNLNTTFYGFPSEFFLRVPIKIEVLKRISNKIIGIGIISQLNDTYSLLNKNLHDGNYSNSVGSKSNFGFNSSTFLYNSYSLNNYPQQAFNLNLILSIKI